MNKKRALYFLITNNTIGIIPVSLLNSFLPYNNVFNQTTRYVWDITSVVYSPLSFSLQAKFSAGASFSNFSGSMAAGNANALLAALNSLNIGVFWLETTATTTYVVTWNDNVIYGNLIIGTASVPFINVNWFNYTEVAGGFLKIDVNSVNVLTSLNLGSSVNEGTVQVSNGDTIDVNVTASPGETTDFAVTRALIAAPYTQSTLYSSTVPGSGSDSYSFTADSLYNYFVRWVP